MADAFNFAMASWGLSGAPSPELFERVVQLSEDGYLDGPNFHQCMAYAYWATNRSDKALESVDLSRKGIQEQNQPDFSPWRYLEVSVDEFLDDLARVTEMINGGDVRPAFLDQGRR